MSPNQRLLQSQENYSDISKNSNLLLFDVLHSNSFSTRKTAADKFFASDYLYLENTFGCIQTCQTFETHLKKI